MRTRLVLITIDFCLTVTHTPFPEKRVAEQLKGLVPGIPKASIIMVKTRDMP